MTSVAMQTIQSIANEFHLSQETIIQESLKVFLEKRLREIKTEIFKIYGKYRVNSVEALESCFENGTVEEKDALDDYHKLDHLEFKRDEISRFLQGLQ
jgi:Holliday junction resolvasome RuvABC endonuclease subunit